MESNGNHVDNSTGMTELYAVIHTQIEKLPFAEDIEEYMPNHYVKVYTESVEDDFDKDRDLSFTYMDDLIPMYYKKQRKACPIEIKLFDDLLEQTVTGVDGESYFIDSYENYFECYGIAFENIYWIRSVPVFVCIATSLKAAEKFITEHSSGLSDMKIVPIEADKLIPAGQIG